eukprot:m.23026 g.23026  ORF g.23026 m.23026 type:complete len:339 (+) comp7458_c0_seq1:1461-2477(+)
MHQQGPEAQYVEKSFHRKLKKKQVLLLMMKCIPAETWETQDHLGKSVRKSRDIAIPGIRSPTHVITHANHSKQGHLKRKSQEANQENKRKPRKGNKNHKTNRPSLKKENNPHKKVNHAGNRIKRNLNNNVALQIKIKERMSKRSNGNRHLRKRQKEAILKTTSNKTTNLQAEDEDEGETKDQKQGLSLIVNSPLLQRIKKKLKPQQRKNHKRGVAGERVGRVNLEPKSIIKRKFPKRMETMQKVMQLHLQHLHLLQLHLLLTTTTKPVTCPRQHHSHNVNGSRETKKVIRRQIQKKQLLQQNKNKLLLLKPVLDRPDCFFNPFYFFKTMATIINKEIL